MKRFLKVFLSLFILVLILVFAFALTFDPNNYKKEIVDLVKKESGRTLSIDGDISLSFFPWIGLELGEIKINNAKGFTNQNFAKMSRLQVRAKLWPLFSQKLEADTLVIEGLTLNLTKNKHGATNWDDFIKPAPKKTGHQPPSTTQNKPRKTTNSTKNVLAAFALNGIHIKNAEFNWQDQQQKQNIRINNVQLSMGKLRPETKVPFNLQFDLKEKSVNANVRFKSEVSFSSNFNAFSFYDTNLTTKLKLASLKKPLTSEIKSELMQLDLNKQTFNTERLTLSDGTFKLQVKISASKIFSKTLINSQLILKRVNLRTLANNFDIALPKMADKNTLTKLEAKLNLRGTLDNLSLSNMKVTLDDTNLTGQAKIKPAAQASSVKLFIDNINLDRYLAKPSINKRAAKKVNTVKSTHSNKKTNDAVLIPLAVLGSININANINVKKIKIKKTRWNNVNLVMRARKGQIQIKPLTFQGYDAKVQSRFSIKSTKNTALLSGNLNIKNIKAGQLLNDYMGKDKLKGITSLATKFTTSGIQLSQLKKNLNGTLKLNLKNGTLKGFDLNYQQKVFKAKINRQPIPVAPKPAETKIATLSASAIIKKGILINKDLRAATPLARIIGSGTVNIPKEKINYVASVKFTSSTKINPTTTFEKMNSLPLDIKIKGSFDSPRFEVDFNKALNLLLKKELKKQKSKIKNKVKKDIQKELEKRLGDKLKNLFKL